MESATLGCNICRGRSEHKLSEFSGKVREKVFNCYSLMAQFSSPAAERERLES